jgi:integrase
MFWRKVEEIGPANVARSARNSSLESRSARTRLRIRHTPYFAKIAKGLSLGYYRGAVAGSWIARFYRGTGNYDTSAIGPADDTLEADGITVFDYWQAQERARQWGERQRLIAAGGVRKGPYTVADAVRDYLAEITAEKKPVAVQGARYVFDAWILPELGSLEVEKLSTDRLNRWRNKLATQPKRVRTKKTATEQATRETPDDDDARRARKATANRILTMLKAALNRAFDADRVSSDTAWRKVKPFKRVDEAVARYLSAPEARRLVNACGKDFQKLVQAALLTGCRYAELTRLKCGEFNPDSGTLAIRLSKGKVGHVVLTDEAKAAFAGWTSDRDSADLIFLRADGQAWGTSHQKRPLEEASVRAKITPAVTFHILRHTHGSHLAMRGVPMGVIAAQLGHADTRMTEKHYAHLAPSYVAETIRANFPHLGIAQGSQILTFPRKNLVKQAHCPNSEIG